jgi:hypothetical protein
MSTTDQQWQDRMSLAIKAMEANTTLLNAATSAIRKLDEKYTISVEVLEGPATVPADSHS